MTFDPGALEPPLLMPDVAGGDAGRAGLPRRSDLSARDRLIVDASAFADIGLRTAVASMVAAAMIPSVLTTVAGGGQSRREQDRLRYYADLAGTRDPATAFPAPTVPPRIRSRRCGNRGAPCRTTAVRFQHWRHSDGPRPTLCVIHGFMGSAYLFNGLFFSLPWFFRSGYDVVLFTLPFHGRRAEKYSPFSGYGYFAHGMSGFAESMAQAVHDFRSVVDYLESTGVDRIALTGLSLGGYTSALLAAVDDRLQAVIPNVPVVSVAAELKDWFPANMLFRAGERLGRIEHRDFLAATAYHSPLNYPSRPRCCGSTGIAVRCTGSPATTSCTSASRPTCAG